MVFATWAMVCRSVSQSCTAAKLSCRDVIQYDKNFLKNGLKFPEKKGFPVLFYRAKFPNFLKNHISVSVVIPRPVSKLSTNLTALYQFT